MKVNISFGLGIEFTSDSVMCILFSSLWEVVKGTKPPTNIAVVNFCVTYRNYSNSTYDPI